MHKSIYIQLLASTTSISRKKNSGACLPLLLIALLNVFFLKASPGLCEETPSPQVEQQTSTEPTKPSDTTFNDVSWDLPLAQHRLPNGRIEMVLTGKNQTSTAYELSVKSILAQLPSGEIQQLTLSESLLSLPTTLAAHSSFSLRLALPPGKIQLMLQIVSERAELLQISIDVPQNFAENPPAPGETAVPARSNKYSYFSIGLGGEYLGLSEESGISSTQFSVYSLSGPSRNFDGSFQLAPKWKIRTTYKSLMGKTNSAPNFSVDRSSYQWSIYSGEAVFQDNRFETQILGLHLSLGFRLGLQGQSLPIILPVTQTEVQIKNSEVYFVSLGAEAICELTEVTSVEARLGTLYPLPLELPFKVSPGPALSASIGFAKRFASRWRAETTLSSQFESFPFSYPGNSLFSSGTYRISYAGLNFGLGYIF